MNISKITLWLTNVAIALAVIGLTALVIQQMLNVNRFTSNKGKQNVEGAISKTERVNISTPFYDLEYLFVFRNGEIYIDNNFICFNNVTFSNDYAKAMPVDFIEATKQGNKYNMPINGAKVYLPIKIDEVLFYCYLSVFITIVASILKLLALFWVRRLIMNFIHGAFFIPQNHLVISRLGLLFLFSAFAVSMVGLYFFDSNALSISLPEGYSLDTISATFNWNYLYLGLLLLATATAFKQGLSLQNEQDLTI
jgi:hypothetical protein